MNSHIILKLCR